jgi:ABC-2 type transport system permease protein
VSSLAGIDRGALGTPIKGPSAIGVDTRRFLNLTRTLAVTEFKLKFYGSALGYVWQLLRPLLLFGVIYLFFTEFVNVGGGEFYGVGLLMGIMFFTFFADATQASVTSLVDREILVRKIQFPRLAVPLAAVLTALFNLALNMVVVFIFLIASGGDPHWSWLELPVLLTLLAAFATGVSMLLAALFVRYRDLKPIWEVVLQALYFVSLILIPWDVVKREGGAALAHLAVLNPLAAIVQQTRHAVIDPGAASAARAAGGWERLLVPGGIVVIVFVLGYVVFDRAAPRIAEEL